MVKKEIPGPVSQKLRAEEDELIANGLQGFALMSGIVVDHAKGSEVFDVDGNRYIDVIGGIGVNGLGHSHPKWIKGIKDQIEKVSVGSFSSESRLNLLKKIKKITYNNLFRLQLYSSGAEAVESALRLAKNYTGKYELASFAGGFHGKTQGVLALLGSNFKDTYAPFAPGNHVLPYANCYRCPFKLDSKNCGLLCVEQARIQLKNNVTSGLAAMIAEPIQGTAGNVIPHDDFLPAMREVAKEFNALYISDEMITGFGRTGTFWGSEHSGVKPDIMTIGKQFGGGFPMSGILTSDEINKTKPWGQPSGSSSSYGANPLASKAAETTISIIEEEKLVENSKQLGHYFLEQLLPLQEEYSFIGEVRGRGLMLAIEFVEDKKSKTPLKKEKMEWLFNNYLQKGLLTMAYTSSFRIQPSMTIDKTVIDEAVQIIKKGISEFKTLAESH